MPSSLSLALALLVPLADSPLAGPTPQQAEQVWIIDTTPAAEESTELPESNRTIYTLDGVHQNGSAVEILVVAPTSSLLKVPIPRILERQVELARSMCRNRLLNLMVAADPQ